MPKSHLRVGLTIFAIRIREYVLSDSIPYRVGVGFAALASGAACLLFRLGSKALSILSAVHRAAYVRVVDRVVEKLLRSAFAGMPFARPLADAARGHIAGPLEGPAQLTTNPNRLLGPLAMVLRSPADGQKGVILLQYNYVFPLFARHFDVPRIAERYHFVLEPSWSGYCNPDILCYAAVAPRVFVQAFEPRDQQFLRSVGAGFTVVPTSANWWVDHRVFHPLPAVTKDVDVIMVAGWGHYKRHVAFFRALRRLHALHPSVRVLLVGYGLGLSAPQIKSFAEYYGVADTLEILEDLTQPQVNEQLNRARVNVLWSRREGVNRAIVEGMFAGVPCVVREGFNYGHRYEYINDDTGAFATEETLPRVILTLMERSESMDPRAWVMAHMSCQRSTEILRASVAEHGSSSALEVKVNGLHGMEYWNGDALAKFQADYDFLRAMRR